MKKIDISRIKSYSLKNRASKVRINDFSRPPNPSIFKDFFSSLPNILAAQHFKRHSRAIVQARKDKRPVMLGMGAHSIKVGLSPVIIDLMERGIITSLSLNGAGIIHDFKLAFIGQTSEAFPIRRFFLVLSAWLKRLETCLILQSARGRG